jgi:hypothetical protein
VILAPLVGVSVGCMMKVDFHAFNCRVRTQSGVKIALFG